jgi:hypothetical protein
LEAIAAEGVDAQNKLNTNTEVREVHDPCLTGVQKTATDRYPVKRHQSDLDRRCPYANNPTGAFCLKAELSYQARID